MSETAVRFDAVTKRFGSFTAVDGVSFEVPAGSLFGILGSNGAGKTTSIRMLMNIFRPDEGSVAVLGDPASEALKPRVGYLPEERGLYRKMRVREMLYFFGSIKGRSKAELDPEIDRWLDRMELTEWQSKRAESLSKGMSQKLQFVITVIHRPELVVLDEPFAGLDPVNRDVLRDAVLDMNRGGTTVVFSTHVMEQAEQLCRELVLIHRGRVRLSGTIEAVRADEGRKAAHVTLHRDGRAALDNLPGVVDVHDHGNDVELTLADGVDPNALARALLERGRLTRFEVRDPSLHQIFKRVVGGEA